MRIVLRAKTLGARSTLSGSIKDEGNSFQLGLSDDCETLLPMTTVLPITGCVLRFNLCVEHYSNVDGWQGQNATGLNKLRKKRICTSNSRRPRSCMRCSWEGAPRCKSRGSQNQPFLARLSRSNLRVPIIQHVRVPVPERCFILSLTS